MNKSCVNIILKFESNNKDLETAEKQGIILSTLLPHCDQRSCHSADRPPVVYEVNISLYE